MRCLAEGVETEEQLQFLELEGCVEVQGFYFSRPVSAGEIGRMLSRQLVAAIGCARALCQIERLPFLHFPIWERDSPGK